MEENLCILSNCLNQAGQVVQDLATNSGRNVVAGAIDETSTSTNTGLTSVGQAVTRARGVMRQSTARGFYSRLNSRERLRASPSTYSAPVKSKRFARIQIFNIQQIIMFLLAVNSH